MELRQDREPCAAPCPSSPAHQTLPAAGAFGRGRRRPWSDAGRRGRARRPGGKLGRQRTRLTRMATGDHRVGVKCLCSAHWSRNGNIGLTYAKRQGTNWSLVCLKLCRTERKREGVSVCVHACACAGERAEGGSVPPSAPTPSSNHFFAGVSDHLLFTGIEN